GSSSGRANTRVPSSARSMEIGSGSVWVNSPLGPVTFTSRSATSTVTPLGTVTGSRPVRDMSSSLPSPHVGEDFPTYTLFGRRPPGQQTMGRRDDGHTQPAKNPRHIGGLGVHA